MHALYANNAMDYAPIAPENQAWIWINPILTTSIGVNTKNSFVHGWQVNSLRLFQWLMLHSTPKSLMIKEKLSSPYNPLSLNLRVTCQSDSIICSTCTFQYAFHQSIGTLSSPISKARGSFSSLWTILVTIFFWCYDLSSWPFHGDI